MAKPTLYQMLEYLGVGLTSQMKTILRALKKGEVEENKLAEALKIRVNDVRKLMYELSRKGFVKYKKLKSDDKQWWYIYLWELDTPKIEGDYLHRKEKDLFNLKEQLAQTEKETYRCDSCQLRASTEEALDVGFICTNCGEALSEIKRKGTAAQLERDIKKLEQEISACGKK